MNYTTWILVGLCMLLVANTFVARQFVLQPYRARPVWEIAIWRIAVLSLLTGEVGLLLALLFH